MGLGRELWIRLGRSAAEGRRTWRGSAGSGGLERALWIAATVLMAIPIFALLVLAVLSAASLTFAALVVGWLWSMFIRAGFVRPRSEVTVVPVSPHRSDR